MPNTRLKRLLDKKRNASMMPKAKLAEYEDEYYDLLGRIESERKKLGIDDESIVQLKQSIEKEHGHPDCRRLASKETMKRIGIEEKAIDKAARMGDLDDLEYHKKALIALWTAARSDAGISNQIALFDTEGENTWTSGSQSES